MITATERAAQKLKNILVQRCSEIGLGFRVKHLSQEYGHAIFSIEVDKERPEDVVIQSNGVKVLLHKETAAVLGKYELDYAGESDGDFSLKNKDDSNNPQEKPHYRQLCGVIGTGCREGGQRK